MNLAHMLNLDTPNLMRSINPQTDTEVALYERLYEAERSLSFYHEAINDFSELGSSDQYPELFSGNIEAIINERDKLKEALKLAIDDLQLVSDEQEGRFGATLDKLLDAL